VHKQSIVVAVVFFVLCLAGSCIGGFRGEGAMSPKMPKSSFCLAYAVHFCRKTNKIDTKCMHVRGFSCPKKRLLPGLRPDDRLLPKKSTFVFGYRPQFLALGG